MEKELELNLYSILKNISSVIKSNICCLYFIEEKTSTPELALTYETSNKQLQKKIAKLSNRIARETIIRNKLQIGDKILAYPLQTKEKIEGAIVFYYYKKHKFTEKQIKLNSLLITSITNEIEKWKLIKKSKILSMLTNIDGLTELYNHRYFHELLSSELPRAQRFKYPLCLLMFDIDNFKKYNDTYGHPQGDLVLKEIAGIIKRNIRAYDFAARYGGEELSVIFPHTARQKALLVAERIRREVAMHRFSVKKNEEKVKVTISGGVAAYPANAQTKTELIKRADQALYLAKKEGRNRICSSLVSGEKVIRFVFCPPSLNPFSQNVLIGLQGVAGDVGNVEVTIYTAKTDTDYPMQLEMLEKAVDSTPDVLAIFSKVDVGYIVKKSNQKGIPVFGFNSTQLKMTPPGNVVSHVGYDQQEAGQKVGEYLVRLLRSQGKIAILEGPEEEKDSQERKEGFLKIISKYPKMKLVASHHANWERNKARKIALEMLKKYPDIDAFFGLNDEMALGATDAVEIVGKKGLIFTIGLDGNQNALQSIKNGELTATLNTNPMEMGRRLMRTVLRSMTEEEEILPIIKSPINIVDMENIDQYLL